MNAILLYSYVLNTINLNFKVPVIRNCYILTIKKNVHHLISGTVNLSHRILFLKRRNTHTQLVCLLGIMLYPLRELCLKKIELAFSDHIPTHRNLGCVLKFVEVHIVID